MLDSCPLMELKRGVVCVQKYQRAKCVKPGDAAAVVTRSERSAEVKAGSLLFLRGLPANYCLSNLVCATVHRPQTPDCAAPSKSKKKRHNTFAHLSVPHQRTPKKLQRESRALVLRRHEGSSTTQDSPTT